MSAAAKVPMSTVLWGRFSVAGIGTLVRIERKMSANNVQRHPEWKPAPERP